jgi:hypothetical protein
MMKTIIALFVCLLSAILPTSARAACGANGDVFELTFTEEVNFLSCGAYELYENDPYLYEFPLAWPGEGCTPQVEPHACEINDSMTCEVDPVNGARTWLTVAYYDVELVDNGGGTLTITVEDEWSGFICFLQYDVYVSEIL